METKMPFIEMSENELIDVQGGLVPVALAFGILGVALAATYYVGYAVGSLTN